MTHILSNLSKEYQTIVEILENKLNDKYDPLIIERIYDNFFEKLNK